MRPSPGLLLAALLVLIAAQVTRLLAPDRGHYLWSVALAAAGLVGAELVAATGHLGGPSVGVVHPLLDIALMAALEAAGAMLLPPRQQGGR